MLTLLVTKGTTVIAGALIAQPSDENALVVAGRPGGLVPQDEYSVHHLPKSKVPALLETLGLAEGDQLKGLEAWFQTNMGYADKLFSIKRLLVRYERMVLTETTAERRRQERVSTQSALYAKLGIKPSQVLMRDTSADDSVDEN